MAAKRPLTPMLRGLSQPIDADAQIVSASSNLRGRIAQSHHRRSGRQGRQCRGHATRLRRDRARSSTGRRSGSIDLRGGGPGTRETALLDPAQTVEGIDAITLVRRLGIRPRCRLGRAGVAASEQGRGFAVGPSRVPIVPGAILFDLTQRRRQELGPFSALSGTGLRGGRGGAPISRSAASGPAPAPRRSTARAASARPRRKRPSGRIVGALAAVNAAGSVLVGGGPWFWAAPFEQNGEFGGRGLPDPLPADALELRTKGSARASTTLVVVATDAKLTKAQAKRLADHGADGLARAIYPIHTPLDGDVVFAVSTGRKTARRSDLQLDRTRRDLPPMWWRAQSRAAFLRHRRSRSPAQCGAGRINSAVECVKTITAHVAETTVDNFSPLLTGTYLVRIDLVTDYAFTLSR